MATIKPEHPIHLLAKKITDPEIERLKKDADDCEVEDFDPIISYSFYSSGLCLMFDDKVLGTIMLYSKGVEDYQEYPHPLPHSLRFPMKKAEVRALLGKPGQVGEDTDIYIFADHVIYVEYLGRGKTISILTLMTPEKYAE